MDRDLGPGPMNWRKMRGSGEIGQTTYWQAGAEADDYDNQWEGQLAFVT